MAEGAPTAAGVGDREIVAIEDITDQAEQHEDLEETGNFIPLEPEDEVADQNVTRFENVIDEILNRNCGISAENEVIADIMDTGKYHMNIEIQ